MAETKIDIIHLKTKMGLNPDGATIKYATERASHYMEPYVPARINSGQLRRSVDISRAGWIVYNAVYSHYMYVGILYVDPNTGSPYASRGVTKVPTNVPLVYHNPSGQTGSYWDLRMITAEGDKLNKDIQKFIEGRLKK